MATCDIQTSLSNNPCLFQLNESELFAYMADLLCQIKVSIASGGGGISFLSGHGSPNGVVTGQIDGQTYVDLDTGSISVFTGTVGTTAGWFP